MQSQCTEVWREIPESKGLYEVSTEGRIRSVPIDGSSGRQRGRILKGTKNRKGYRWFRIEGTDGTSKYMAFHRAVAATFIGACPDGMQVNHKDGNKENNRPENLEYVTCETNVRHSWENGLHANDRRKGEDHNMVKLTDERVRKIRSDYPAKSLTELAEEHRVTKQAIWFIVHRKTWRHVI